MLTDQQISILVDIASGGGLGIPPQQLSILMDLVAEDYAVATDSPLQRYELTAKGQRVLDERGVGANES